MVVNTLPNHRCDYGHPCHFRGPQVVTEKGSLLAVCTPRRISASDTTHDASTRCSGTGRFWPTPSTWRAPLPKQKPPRRPLAQSRVRSLSQRAHLSRVRQLLSTATLPSQVPLPLVQTWCPSEIFCAGAVRRMSIFISLAHFPFFFLTRTCSTRPCKPSRSLILMRTRTLSSTSP